jgi:hypothetical protein
MIGSKAAYQDSWIRFTVCSLLLWGGNKRNKVTMVLLGQICLGFHRTRIDTVFLENAASSKNAIQKERLVPQKILLMSLLLFLSLYWLLK